MRNRLLASVALCAVAVLAAGAPTVVAASDDATDAQRLVDDAKLSRDAIALSHSLADERDDLVEYIAAGRTSRGGAGVSEGQRARVDRQINEIRGSAPAGVRKDLASLPRVRQRAIAGHGGALTSYKAYSEIVAALRGVSRDVARALPERAQDDTAGALPDLARALDQASATRGLLRGALAATGPQRALTSEAQRARVREEGALSDFEEAAGREARDSYRTTVNGTDVNIAERYIARLTARSSLTPAAQLIKADRVDTALSARLAHMRGVQSSLATAEVKRLEELRDDDVDALQIRAALVGVCLLLAVGVSVSTARSLARPLSVLRRGSRRLADDPAGEPVAFHGRNDEFADVVRALNSLRDSAAELHGRVARAEGEQDELAVAKAELTERYELLRQDYEAAREQLGHPDDPARTTYIHLSLRTLGLVERQLGVIEQLEEKETDPDRLGTLFKLDHLATRMRRHTENLLLLAGAEHTAGVHQGSAPLLDVLRAAVSEIERYERVALGSVPPHTRINGFASDDLSHLMAELLDNAASFSPPETEVRLSGWLLESGEVAVSVQDSGIGVTDEQLTELNARLSDAAAQEPPRDEDRADGQGGVLGMGLYVVARLAARHGLGVRLSKQDEGGLAAVVTVPVALLPDPPAAPSVTGTNPEEGTEAEAEPEPEPETAEAEAEAEPEPKPEAVAEPVEDRDTTGLPVLRRRRRRAAGVDDWPLGPAAPSTASAPSEETTHGTGTVSGIADAPSDEHARSEDLAPAGARTSDEAAEAEAEAGAKTEPEAEPGAEAEAVSGTNETEHERAAGPTTRGTGAAPVATYTAKGLPKRTPRTPMTGAAPAAPGPRRSGADAEELRRRLGGFQQGAKKGLRDAAAEVAAEGNVEEQAGAQVDGGTAEEARK